MIRLADTLKPMGDFPAADAVDVEITLLDETKKSIQQAYEDGDLGGGGSGDVDQTYNPSSEKAQSGKAVSQAVSQAVNPLQMKYPDGKTWQDSNITSGNYFGLGKADDGTLVVAGSNGIKCSIDNGKTWQNTNITSDSYYTFGKAGDGTLVVGAISNGIKYSPIISFKDWIRKVLG